MTRTAVHPLLGRYHVPEPPNILTGAMHLYKGGPLKEVDHEPRLAVLDQSDLIKQGIDTSALIPGAARVDALGSCVFNATTASLSNALDADTFATLIGLYPGGDAEYSDTVKAEQYAIGLYHETTDLTGDPASEWPPTDCGSSGLYVCRELEHQGVIAGHKVAHGAEGIVSLLQTRELIVGQPWFNAWFDAGKDAFLDGDGTPDALQAAMASGVAGGHETVMSAVEKLTLTAAGQVDAANTVVRCRNSWSASWGDHGSYRMHLSTYVALGNYCDFRLIEAA